MSFCLSMSIHFLFCMWVSFQLTTKLRPLTAVLDATKHGHYQMLCTQKMVLLLWKNMSIQSVPNRGQKWKPADSSCMIMLTATVTQSIRIFDGVIEVIIIIIINTSLFSFLSPPHKHFSLYFSFYFFITWVPFFFFFFSCYFCTVIFKGQI